MADSNSEKVCIERLRPKSVPEGLVALGTVVQVTETILKLQITGGVLCIIPILNISQAYSKALKNFSNDPHEHPEPAKLTDLFKITDTYICKVIEKRPRASYTNAIDLIATLDPSQIYQGVVPKGILAVSKIPLQSAVKSVEDHGYQMDIGLKNVSGFLPFSSKRKFSVGQIVRCYLEKPVEDQEVRIVQLTHKDNSETPFSEVNITNHVVTPSMISPGSKSFLTVLRVSKLGLVVKLMNEFSGFVSKEQLKDIWDDPLKSYKISDTFKCTVLYYNPLTETFALSIRNNDYVDDALKAFTKEYFVGKLIKTAKVASIDGFRSVCFKVDDKWKAIADANDVLDEETGSLSKDEILQFLDEKYSPDSKHTCRIKSINFADLLLVVSTKKEFLELPCVAVCELKPGDFIDAKVKKFVKDGIVISFGLNLRAIIMNSWLDGKESLKSFKKFSVGQDIKCRVLKIDSDKQPPRIYATNKQPLLDKDLVIIDEYSASFKNKSTQALVIKVRQDGLIVELFNNIKGFIPKIFLSTTQVKSIEDLFQLGQVISCTVVRIDSHPRNSLVLGAIPLESVLELKKQKNARKLEKKLERKNRKREIPTEVSLKRKKNPHMSNEHAPTKRLKKFSETSEGSISESSDDSDSDAKQDRMTTEEEDDNDENVENIKEKLSESGKSDKPLIKSRRQRSEEARLREEKLRQKEKELADPNRPPQSITDFERLVLKSPNSSDIWMKYSNFFLDNLETEKSRIVCRRALKTINFRMEKEKLKIWLQLIKIEAKYGGLEKINEVIEEATKCNDLVALYKGATSILSKCGNLDLCDELIKRMLKGKRSNLDVVIYYITYLVETKKNIDESRIVFERMCRNFEKKDSIMLRSKFAQLEFKFGDVERGKTIFENLISDNPKRTDLHQVYASMKAKYG